jgi:hypothetical protein
MTRRPPHSRGQGSIRELPLAAEAESETTLFSRYLELLKKEVELRQEALRHLRRRKITGVRKALESRKVSIFEAGEALASDLSEEKRWDGEAGDSNPGELMMRALELLAEFEKVSGPDRSVPKTLKIPDGELSWRSPHRRRGPKPKRQDRVVALLGRAFTELGRDATLDRLRSYFSAHGQPVRSDRLRAILKEIDRARRVLRPIAVECLRSERERRASYASRSSQPHGMGPLSLDEPNMKVTAEDS